MEEEEREGRRERSGNKRWWGEGEGKKRKTKGEKDGGNARKK